MGVERMGNLREVQTAANPAAVCISMPKLAAAFSAADS
jgi:hypothetical protein